MLDLGGAKGLRPLFVGIRPVGVMRAPASSAASNNERLSSGSGGTNRGGRASRSGIAFRTPMGLMINILPYVNRVAVAVLIIVGINRLGLLISFHVRAPINAYSIGKWASCCICSSVTWVCM